MTDTERIHAARLTALEKRVDELERRLHLATKPVLNISDVADLLGVSRQTAYERINDPVHPLPTRLWGNRQAVLRTDLDAWLAGLPRTTP